MTDGVSGDGNEAAGGQSRAGEAGANLTDVLCAFRDIAYALQSLSSALSPHGHEAEINALIVSAHEAIDRAAHNAEVRGRPLTETTNGDKDNG